MLVSRLTVVSLSISVSSSAWSLDSAIARRSSKTQICSTREASSLFDFILSSSRSSFASARSVLVSAKSIVSCDNLTSKSSLSPLIPVSNVSTLSISLSCISHTVTCSSSNSCFCANSFCNLAIVSFDVWSDCSNAWTWTTSSLTCALESSNLD